MPSAKLLPRFSRAVDTVPFDSDPKDPDALKPTLRNLLPDFDGATPNTLLNYARLTDTELAILVFTLSAADILHPADARPRQYPCGARRRVPERACLCAAPVLRPGGAAAAGGNCRLGSGNAVTIGYGERAADRLVDPYALVLHRDHMYLHAWCRTAEERYYAARGRRGTRAGT